MECLEILKSKLRTCGSSNPHGLFIANEVIYRKAMGVWDLACTHVHKLVGGDTGLPKYVCSPERLAFLDWCKTTWDSKLGDGSAAPIIAQAKINSSSQKALEFQINSVQAEIADASNVPEALKHELGLGDEGNIFCVDTYEHFVSSAKQFESGRREFQKLTEMVPPSARILQWRDHSSVPMLVSASRSPSGRASGRALRALRNHLTNYSVQSPFSGSRKRHILKTPRCVLAFVFLKSTGVRLYLQIYRVVIGSGKGKLLALAPLLS